MTDLFHYWTIVSIFMINQLYTAGHNWSLEFFFTYLIGVDDVRSTERVIRGSEMEFKVLKGPMETRTQSIRMQNVLVEGSCGSWWFFRGRKGLWEVRNCLCLCKLFSVSTFITPLDDLGSICQFFTFLDPCIQSKPQGQTSTKSETLCIRMTCAMVSKWPLWT